MSAAFFIVLDNNEPGFDTMVNGKSLSRDAEKLDEIAQTLGIRSLEEYVSYLPEDARAMMEDFGTAPEEIEAASLPAQQWYNAEDGLEMVTRLADYIRAHPTSVNNPKGVLDDLQEFQEVFEKAKGIGARWNLQVDF